MPGAKKSWRTAPKPPRMSRPWQVVTCSLQLRLWPHLIPCHHKAAATPLPISEWHNAMSYFALLFCSHMNPSWTHLWVFTKPTSDGDMIRERTITVFIFHISKVTLIPTYHHPSYVYSARVLSNPSTHRLSWTEPSTLSIDHRSKSLQKEFSTLFLGLSNIQHINQPCCSWKHREYNTWEVGVSVVLLVSCTIKLHICILSAYVNLPERGDGKGTKLKIKSQMKP